MWMDLSNVDVATDIEHEAVYGGVPATAVSLVPAGALDTDDDRIFGRPADDVIESDERKRALEFYVPYAEQAFQERGLRYPFRIIGSGRSLTVVEEHRPTATRLCELSGLRGKGGASAKQFERLGFRTLHSFVGGWAAHVGFPRDGRTGTPDAIRSFRNRLSSVERGGGAVDPQSAGDHSADGFIILGRRWGGPLVFYQSKNSQFDVNGDHVDLMLADAAIERWFGRRLNRQVLSVLAVNSVLTLQRKEQAFEMRSRCPHHILDVVDVLAFEALNSLPGCPEAELVHL